MTLTVTAVDGIGEVAPGDDIAELITARTTLAAGDVVVVTSKIVSKAAGLPTTRTKDELLAAETDRVVAQRGDTQIVRTHHGLTMAAAGIDNSNTRPGHLVPLPPDPDAAAAQIRSAIHAATGLRVAVIISDTAGRAWREGQTDMAIGCAGLIPLESFAGRTDPYGNPLAVTAPAIADEIAGAAELASGKMGGRPVVVVRGTDPAWHLAESGPGAAALIRDESADMFGLGAREAAVAATLGHGPVRGLPLDASMTIDRLVTMALQGLPIDRSAVSVDEHPAQATAPVAVQIAVEPDQHVDAGALAQRLVSLGIAHGMTVQVRVAPASAD